jgi:DUF4097 and DUF4098 domain-containing protein YvlB
MPDEPDIGRARNEARRAQEEAERLRKEAERLRDQANADSSSARDAAQRLRDEAREAARMARDEANRLRREARELEHRLRDTHREVVREARGSRQQQDAYQDDKPFSLDGITTVSIDQTAGNLTVRFAQADEQPGIAISSTRGTPKVEVTRSGAELRIEIEQKTGWIFRRKQGISALVRLAPGLEHIDASIGYGDLEVRDLAAGSMKLSTGAGKIVGYSTSGDVKADVGAGRINLNVHRGLATAHTGTGDVTLDIAEVVAGKYDVECGIGRIEVRLPAGAPIYVQTSTGMGKTTNRFGGSPDEHAPSRLRANTGIGELVVRTRDETAATPRPETPARNRPGRPPAARRHEVEELRILQLLEQGRISSQEAAELIAALQGAAPPLPEDGEEPEGPPENPPSA